MNVGPKGRTALILGASGLVGEECLRLLVADDTYTRLRVLVRRPLTDPPPSPRLEVAVIDFNEPGTYADLMETDHFYCAIGTTMKKARTREAFRKIDLEIPLSLATLARGRGASHFLLVSSLGANPRAHTFYSRVKGELEEALLGLRYPSLTVVRPSLLLGNRRERRAAEELAARATPFIPLRWKPVPARIVAQALVAAGREDRPGVRRIENLDLHRREGF